MWKTWENILLTILVLIKHYYVSCKQMFKNLNVCDICVLIVNVKSFLLYVLQWSLLMVWPDFTFLPNDRQPVFSSFLPAFPSLLLIDSDFITPEAEARPLLLARASATQDFHFFCMFKCCLSMFPFFLFKGAVSLCLIFWLNVSAQNESLRASNHGCKII